ncbi:DUF6415 family natural product biosynthesis protein [Streptomyces sp. ISL-11]|uniref:DUF6415 family natural product biosynthesis protein n=1 Tax=Streptomyces sp. ISL-11 TaxID=2819174 RepID=UPI001BE9AD61|nr:DUF6415 family natural product biosynthesis protein [Streptomyces sp. ISL-11]MBT2383154.1 hypothetical protein [Streptomyces sp. ISL-11]
MNSAATTPGADRFTAEMRHALTDAVGRALAPSAVLPRAEAVEDLTERLRSFVTRLVPHVEDRARRMDHGTAEWHQARSALSETRRVLGAGPGTGLRSAVGHMQDLGRVCHRLRCHLPLDA